MVRKRGNDIVRNFAFLIMIVFTISLVSTAHSHAKEKQLVILGLGGKIQEVVEEYARDHGIEVSYRTLPYYASARYLQSQPEIGTVDLFIAYDVLIEQIGRLGMLEELDFESLREKHHLYPYAEIKDRYGVAIGTIATGIVYFPLIFGNQNLTVPDSWKNLYQPQKKLEGHIAIPDITTTCGWQNAAAVTMALDKKELIQGFNAIEQVKPFFLIDSPVDLVQLFEEEKVWLSPCTSTTALTLIENNKFLVEFIYPSEGVPLSKIGISKARQTPQSDAADKFIDLLLSTEFQERAAKYLYLGPVNSKISLTGNAKKVLPYGDLDEIKVDWSYIDKHKFELTEKWSELFY